MTERHLDHRHLDLTGLARQGRSLSGATAQDALPRLASSVCLDVLAVPEVTWSARPEWRPVPAGAPQLWLHLSAQTAVTLVCQRCLQTLTQALIVERSFLFVADEDEAVRLDEASDDDVLVLPKALDLQELMEDELILALPIVPRHETCPEPLLISAAPELELESATHPFAALAALRGGTKLN